MIIYDNNMIVKYVFDKDNEIVFSGCTLHVYFNTIFIYEYKTRTKPALS